LEWSHVISDLRIEDVPGYPARQQVLVLLWAISRAVKGYPRLTAWDVARREIRSMFTDYGLPGASSDPAHPVVMLARTRLWSLDGHSPSSWQVDVRQWCAEHRPRAGLTPTIYRAVSSAPEQRVVIVDELLTRYFAGEDTRRLRAKALDQLVWRGYGAVPGVEPGAWFRRRVDLSLAGVHRVLQSGICGRRESGCESVALVGGYEDDIDHGDVIVFTGEGGRDAKTGRQIMHQRLSTGNASLVTSMRLRKPVRVVRGSIRQGYTYAGLFLVDDYWQAMSRTGFRIWQFKLVSIESTIADATGEGAEDRRSLADRMLHTSLVIDQVMKANDYTCQFCGARNDTPIGPYAEIAHLRPIGGRHGGLGVAENTLCLCPTHHKLFDLGAFVIDDDRMVIDVMNGLPFGPLIETQRHRIDIEDAAYHRGLRPK
jgi:predicted restriction endonuclease